MWAMRSFINPSIMFPARFAATASGVIFLLFSPRAPTHTHTRAHTHTQSLPFCGVTRRWRQYSSAQFPILEKTLFKRPRYFFLLSPSRRGGSRAISFATRATHLHMTILCTAGESEGIGSLGPFRPSYPSGLFMQERVSSDTRYQSY